MGEKVHTKPIALTKKRVHESLDMCVQAHTHCYASGSVYVYINTAWRALSLYLNLKYINSSNWHDFINSFRKFKEYDGQTKNQRSC